MELSVAEIPIWYGGLEKWITGIHKKTTCNDVVKALITSCNSQECKKELQKDLDDYVIVERWRKVEKPLDGSSKILKLWNKWGEEQSNVRLSLKKIIQSSAPLKDSTNRQSYRSNRRHHSKSCRKISASSSKSWHPKKLSNDGKAIDMSETVDKLMKLIMSQTETISYQLSRLLDKDKQIEEYENELHQLRMSQIGTNYVQEAYLCDTNDSDAKPEVKCAELTVEETEIAIKLYENMLELSVRLVQEEETIEKLSKEMVEEKESVRERCKLDDGETMRVGQEIELMKSELERINSIHRSRENVLSQNNRFVVDSERTLNEKMSKISQLENEIRIEDMETERLQQQYDLLCAAPETETETDQTIIISSMSLSSSTYKGDTESLDSDTGLSSLHSSCSDESTTYVLNTLV